MFEREGVAQTVNVVNGVFVRFVPPLVRHADAESEPDGVSRLLFGPLLSEYRIIERRGEFSLPVHVRKAAPPRDAVRALVAAVFGTRVAVVGNQRQRIARFSVIDVIIVVTVLSLHMTGRWGSPCPYM